MKVYNWHEEYMKYVDTYSRYRNTHKAEIRILNQAYNIKYKEDIAKRHNIQAQELRQKLINILGSQCIKCGYDMDKRILQIDHKSGGGRKEYRKFKNYTGMIRYYLNHVDEAKEKLQILCPNCNRIKMYDNREYIRKYKY